MVQNTARAAQLQAVADLAVACGADPTTISPMSEVGIEVGGVLGVSEATVADWLDKHQRLTRWLPGVWALCVAGRLDLWRAQVFLDAADTLADEDEILLFAAEVDAYLAKYDDPGTAVVRLSRAKLQRAAQYRAMKRTRKDSEVTYSEAFSKRRAWFRPDENGIGSLGVRTGVHDLLAADYRLTLIAKLRMRDDNQGRTLEQMRADTLVDLLLGRLEVTADRGPGGGETADGHDPSETFRWSEVGAFGRPVINVTVPISALMGADDEPGLLSGDIAIPADLARQIALQPGSTWHRRLVRVLPAERGLPDRPPHPLARRRDLHLQHVAAVFPSPSGQTRRRLRSHHRGRWHLPVLRPTRHRATHPRRLIRLDPLGRMPWAGSKASSAASAG